MTSSSSPAGAWARFRRRSWHWQLLLWVLLWPVPLLMWTVSKPAGRRRPAGAVAALGLVAWIVAVVAGAAGSNSSTPASHQVALATTSTSSIKATTTTVHGAGTTRQQTAAVHATTTARSTTTPTRGRGGTGSSSTAAAPITATGCRPGDPLSNVYHPWRLHVEKSCLTVSGTVVAVRHEEDGDIHVNVRLDPAYAGLIDERNVSGEGGALVTEIVPADQPGCTVGQPPRPATGTYNYGICTGADEATPAVGTRVTVTGPYDLDADHGWMEIHPVWSITATASSSPAPASSPSTQATTATVTTRPAQPAAGVTIKSVTSPVAPGQIASLVAQTSPGAACSLAVTLPSGATSQSQGLGPATAGSSGVATWSWKIGTRTKAGTATATVTCTGGSASVHFEIT